MIRKFDLEKDYDTLTAWWNAHGSFPPEPNHLSDTGLVVEIDEKPVCAGFLYQTDSSICVFEFVVCDPKSSKENREFALMDLIESMKNIAKAKGYELVYSSIGIPSFVNRLEKSGFIKADTNQTHMFFDIKGNNEGKNE